MRKALMTLLGVTVIVALSVIVAAQGDGRGRENRVSGQAGGRIVEGRRAIRAPRFGVEVLAGGGAREKYPARGRVYVEAVEGEEYSLRLSNPLPVRVAVALSVDGLNTIDARRTSARDASKWVIPPYSSIVVGGWQMSSTRARRFYFTDERDSYANKLGRATDLGVITAVFFRERGGRAEIVPPPRPRPLESQTRDGEHRGDAEHSAQRSAPPVSAQSGAGNSSGRVVAPPSADEDYAATGIGRSVGNDVWRVEMDLEPQPAAEVTIRYEFRDALVRLGVLPRTYPQPDPLRRRERARGFEDGSFSPEP